MSNSSWQRVRECLSIHLVDLLAEHLHGGVVLASDVWQHEEDFITGLRLHVSEVGVPVSADASGKIHVFLLDGHSLGVDGAEVGVLKEADDVGFSGFLQGEESLGLEAEAVIHVHGDATNETLEGGTREHHLSRLLISLDLAKSDGTRLEPSHLLLLHATRSRGSLLDGFRAFNHGHFGGSLGLGSNFGLGHSDEFFKF